MEDDKLKDNNQPSREELRARLREKLNNKKKTRTHSNTNKKKLNNYADKLKKVCNCVDKYGLNSEDPIPQGLVEEVKNIIDEAQLNEIMEYLKNTNNAQLNESMMKFLETIYKEIPST